jgi:hypothetical protein
MEYDQRVIIRFLWNDGTDANQMTARLQAQFGEHAYKLQTIPFWIAEVRFGCQDLHDEIRTGRAPLDDRDATILAILDKSRFESICSRSERLHVGHVTVLEHLYVSIGFKSFHLRWMLHLLTDDLRQNWKQHARAMLPFLHTAQRDGLHHLMTGDESWFFFNTSLRRMWTLSRDDVVRKPRLDIQSKKFMFMIMWNPSSFCIVDRLPNDTKMNSDYFVTNILVPLEQMIFPRGRAPHQKRHVVISTIPQLTQVGLQQIGSKNMACAACHTHPPYSPDLAPVTSTCFLQ